jgi:hypothetical protein
MLQTECDEVSSPVLIANVFDEAVDLVLIVSVEVGDVIENMIRNAKGDTQETSCPEEDCGC